MFSEACVSHSVHRGSPSRGRSSWADTPLDRDALHRDPWTETLDRDLLTEAWTETWTETPWTETSPGQRLLPDMNPLDRGPLERDPSGQRPSEGTWDQTGSDIVHPWKEHGTR